MKAIAGPQFSKYANRKHEQVRVTMPSNFSKRDARLRPSAARLPEYYVLLCAHRYAAAVEKLAAAATDDEQRQAKMRLAYIMDSGMIEFESEVKRRQRPFPEDFRKALVEQDGSIITRPIGREESEILRYSSAVPAFTSIDNLSAVEMEALADMFEGWAQNGRLDGVRVAQLHGWADSFRSLTEVIGIDYIPPEKPPGAPVSLMKFMALRMFK